MMDAEKLLRHLIRAIHADQPGIDTGDIGLADACLIAEIQLSDMRDWLHSLIAAAVGGGGPVDVVAYVEGEHGGDWSKAVKFACELIASNYGHRRPSEVRGTYTLSDPDRR